VRGRCLRLYGGRSKRIAADEHARPHGRPTKLNPKQRRIIAERYAAGETAAALACEFEVGEATIWRALNPET
jgi:hypothetical protein